MERQKHSGLLILDINLKATTLINLRTLLTKCLLTTRIKESL